MVGSIDEIPQRGDMIPVHYGNRVADAVVQTIDLAGYPTVGEERFDDAEKYGQHRDILSRRLGKQVYSGLTLEEELVMLDMGDIGRDLAR